MRLLEAHGAGVPRCRCAACTSPGKAAPRFIAHNHRSALHPQFLHRLAPPSEPYLHNDLHYREARSSLFPCVYSLPARVAHVECVALLPAHCLGRGGACGEIALHHTGRRCAVSLLQAPPNWPGGWEAW